MASVADFERSDLVKRRDEIQGEADRLAQQIRVFQGELNQNVGAVSAYDEMIAALGPDIVAEANGDEVEVDGHMVPVIVRAADAEAGQDAEDAEGA